MTMRALVLLAVLLLTACADGDTGPIPQKQLPIAEVTLVSPDGKNTVWVDAEVAAKPEQREIGLMGRTEISAYPSVVDTGMLFVFSEQQRLSFWMSGTLIPLDVLFFDRDGRFVSSAMMVPCPHDTDCAIYPSKKEALYALEVAAGSVERWKVREGWTLEVQGQLPAVE